MDGSIKTTSVRKSITEMGCVISHVAIKPLASIVRDCPVED